VYLREAFVSKGWLFCSLLLNQTIFGCQICLSRNWTNLFRWWKIHSKLEAKDLKPVLNYHDRLVSNLAFQLVSLVLWFGVPPEPRVASVQFFLSVFCTMPQSKYKHGLKSAEGHNIRNFIGSLTSSNPWENGPYLFCSILVFISITSSNPEEMLASFCRHHSLMYILIIVEEKLKCGHCDHPLVGVIVKCVNTQYFWRQRWKHCNQHYINVLLQ
jgi:hypothetical protein